MIIYSVDIDGVPDHGELTRRCQFCKRLAAYRHWRCGRRMWLCHLCYVALQALGKIVPLQAAEEIETATRNLDDRRPR